MYIPKHFEQNDTSSTIAFMQNFNFALLVSVNDSIPIATHLPFVIEERDKDIVLISHMSKANDQWKTAKDSAVMVVFSEPHAYISPSHYEKQQNVPTWNYVAVHAYGTISVLENDHQKLEVLHKQMRSFEEAYLQQFKTLDQKYIDGLLKGIVAFEILVTDLQSKAKLSQNKTRSEREKIKQELEQSNDTIKQSLGKMM
jgi:transcriptional regulator